MNSRLGFNEQWSKSLWPRRTIGVVLLGLLWALSPAAKAAVESAAPLPLVPLRVRDVAQDATGLVWAIDQTGALFRWIAGRWDEVGFSPVHSDGAAGDSVAVSQHRGAHALLLASTPAGDVWALWSRADGYVGGEENYWLSRHRGARSEPISAFRAWLESADLFVDSKGNGWLTQTGPTIHRVAPDGTVTLAHSLTADQRTVHSDDRLNPVRAGEDGQGRLWFWGHYRVHMQSLRGFLVWDNGQFRHHPVIRGLPEEPFDAVVRKDAKTFWAATHHPQWLSLYAIDTSTLAATRVRELAPGGFDHPAEILSAGPAQFVVSANVLWRFRDGVWTKLVPVLDRAPPPSDGVMLGTRPVLSDERGVWIGANGAGLWLVSAADDSIRRLDWKTGQPLESVHGIFRLPEGRYLLVGLWQGAVEASAEQLLAAPAAGAPALQIWRTGRNLVADDRGHLWSLWDYSGQAMYEWTGAQWVEHPLPQELREHADLYDHYGFDSRGRLWQPYRKKGGKGREYFAIYDPQRQQWLLFDSARQALQAQLVHGADFSVDVSGSLRPAFSGDGRICFQEYDWERYRRLIQYYDGTQWHEWELRSVIGHNRPGHPSLPFFNHTGRLAINFHETSFNKTTREFADGQWGTVGFESAGIREALPFRLPAALRPSPESLTPDCLVQDRSGHCWVTWKQQLYWVGLGRCLPWFAATEPHPFLGVRRIHEVLTDALGNTVLRTGWTYGERFYVVLPPNHPLPDTSLRILSAELGAAEFEVEGGEATSAADVRLAKGRDSGANSVESLARPFAEVRITGIRLSGTPPVSAEISWEALPGVVYGLEFTRELGPRAHWQLLFKHTNTVDVIGPLRIQIPLSAEPMGFYRLTFSPR
ncbi:MAG: hypothetical protein HYY24_10210 [Verrucomicrobia bacterium]|nr:hypothetical protein [Verrucomicrobiota bacterium]